MNKGDLVAGVRNAYVRSMKGVGAGLSRIGVLADTPPDSDRRLRHWAHSLTRVHDSLAIAELDVPWWTYKSIDVVDAWISAHPRPIRVFEYGSGASTLWLARRVDEVHSVEHHAGFAEYLRPELEKHDNITFSVVEPVKSDHPAVPSAKGGHAGLDFSDYVAAIDKVDGRFDIVVIDGRAREACLTAALPRLAPGGIVVFDNTRRARYQQAIAAAGVTERRLAGLTPTLPYPDQTSILSVAG